MEEDWMTQSNVERYKMSKHLKLVRLLIRLSLAIVFASFTSCVFWGLNLIYFSQLNIVSNSSSLQMFIPSAYFIDIQSNPTFEIFLYGQAVGGVIMCLIYCGYDGFYVIAVYHLCSQLSYLKLILRNSTDFSEEILKQIVEKHLRLKK